MQICSNIGAAIRAMPIGLDPLFPMNAPYLDRLHFSKPHPADHMHYHASCEIGVCMQGSGIFYIGNRVHHYHEGDVSIIPPGVIHIAQSDPERISGWKFLDIDFERLLAAFPPEYSALCAHFFCGIIHKEEAATLFTLIVQIIEEMRIKRTSWQQLVRLKAGELAVILNRLSGQTAKETLLPESLHEISPAVLHIVNHYQDAITLSQLSKMCQKSVSSFRRSFQGAMNTTPFEYLYHVRIKAAINLLQTTALPVSEIASRVGYQTLSSFNRHFHRIVNCSPMACRKKVK